MLRNWEKLGNTGKNCHFAEGRERRAFLRFETRKALCFQTFSLSGTSSHCARKLPWLRYEKYVG